MKVQGIADGDHSRGGLTITHTSAHPSSFVILPPNLLFLIRPQPRALATSAQWISLGTHWMQRASMHRRAYQVRIHWIVVTDVVISKFRTTSNEDDVKIFDRMCFCYAKDLQPVLAHRCTLWRCQICCANPKKSTGDDEMQPYSFEFQVEVATDLLHKTFFQVRLA